MLGLEKGGDRLSEQLVDAGIKKAESVRELLQVTGCEVEETLFANPKPQLWQQQGST